MKISVLIAAYNAASFIPKALASVQAQTHRDWELIVVEDGSHDGTEGIVQRLAASESRSVRYENPGVNRGVAAARNLLLQRATGDAVAFLDADDVWAEDHLACGARLLAEGADFVVTGVRTFDLADGRTLGETPPPAELAADPVATLFSESVIVTSSSVFLSRGLAAKTGAFDTQFSVGEDRDYWLRAALSGARFAIAPAATCHYAKHAGSTMGRTLLVAEQAVRFYEKHSSLGAIPAALRRRKLATSLTNHGRLLRATNPQASAGLLYRAWKLQPWNPVAGAQFALSCSRSLFAA